jgi:penicillin-binding protein 1A
MRKARPFIKLKVALLVIVSVIAVTSGASYAILTSVNNDLPQIPNLRNYKPPVGTQIFSEDDHLIGRIKVDKGIFVPYAQIPNTLKKALVAVEDARFYEHGGLDFQGIVRALVKDAFSLSLKEGGSTITQQLAKVLFLTPEKSITRKLKEALLARKIEQTLTKDQIIELYLNKVYFGHGAYGCEMAARTYFGKRVGDLTLGESAMIAGLVRSPSNYSPYNNMDAARSRQKTVLARMVDEKFISRGQADQAAAQTMILKNLRSSDEAAPYLVEQIRMYLEGKYGADKVYMQGLTVKTTINYRFQRAAVKAVEDGIKNHGKRQAWRGPLAKKKTDELEKFQDDPSAGATTFQPGDFLTATVLRTDDKGAYLSARGSKGFIAAKDLMWAAGLNKDKKKPQDILKPGYVVEVKVKSFDKKSRVANFTLEQSSTAQAALVCLDPWLGSIKAMVGGCDFQKNEYNHATLAHRQPGSSFKPFIYAEAMEKGLTPATVINDAPMSYDDDKWKPRNYDGEYYGPTTLREALVQSRNVVTIELLHRVGVASVIDLAKKLGMTGPFARDLTLGLGSCSASPLELTAAYCAFANGGYKVTPYVIESVADARGRVLEKNGVAVEQVMSADAAYQVTSILKDAVTRGTGKLASYLRRPVAGKTGTTNDYKDAWFVGYTPYLVTGVWVGYDDQKSLGHGESGARAALPIWFNYMSAAAPSYPADDFQVPDGIEFVDIDAKSGLLPIKGSEVIKEAFRKGNVPTEFTPVETAVLPVPAADEAVPEDAAKKSVKRLEDAD